MIYGVSFGIDGIQRFRVDAFTPLICQYSVLIMEIFFAIIVTIVRRRVSEQMKNLLYKIAIIILAIVMVFSLIACKPGLNSKENIQDQRSNETIKGESIVVTSEMLNEKQYFFAPEQSEPSNDTHCSIKDSYKDGSNYYYLLYLGTVYNVPLVEPEVVTYNAGSVNFKQEIVFTKITTKSLETTSNKVVSRLEYDNPIAGFEFELGVSELFKTKLTSIGMDFNSNTTTTTDSASQSEKEETTISEMRTLALTIDSECPSGTYRICRAKDYKVYAFAELNTSTKQVRLSYKAVPCEGIITLIEYTSEKRFPQSERIEDFAFDANIIKTLPVPAKVFDGGNQADSLWSKITVSMNRYRCKLDNDYDKSESGDNGWHHDGYEMGELCLYGCKKVDGFYKTASIEDLSIKWYATHNSDPIDNKISDNQSISDDTLNKVKGTNINQKIGYGASWIRVTYNDDTQDQFVKTDLLKNLYKGSYLELLENKDIRKNKQIKQIEVVIAYEIYCYGYSAVWGWTGIPWKQWSNWRLEYTYNFE